MENLSNTSEKKTDAAQSRFIPFSVAGIVCFCAALFLGAGGWYLFGTNRRLTVERNTIAVQSSNQNSAVENSNTSAVSANSVNSVNSSPNSSPQPAAEMTKAPAGEAAVAGGEVTLGGGESELPLRRVAVAPFMIGETEVTNAQYAEFIKDAKRKAPASWKNDEFPATAAADAPVVGVSWADANAYCEWLSKKLGATVRLPGEAEWELAARGNTEYKYPWGNDWNDEAVESAAANRKIRPVKSFPKGRSPVGAYDMVGNVWEWTGDLAVDEAGNPALFEGAKQRIIKGGSVYDNRKFLSIKNHLPRPENKPSDFLGFRYVIIRK